MEHRPEENRFRHLPEPVRPEEMVETVDTTALAPLDDPSEERARMLRQAGGV